MLKRVITGVVAVLILLPVLIFSNAVLFPIAISLISVVSLYELFQCLKMGKRFFVVLPVYAFSQAGNMAASDVNRIQEELFEHMAFYTASVHKETFLNIP